MGRAEPSNTSPENCDGCRHAAIRPRVDVPYPAERGRLPQSFAAEAANSNFDCSAAAALKTANSGPQFATRCRRMYANPPRASGVGRSELAPPAGQGIVDLRREAR